MILVGVLAPHFIEILLDMERGSGYNGGIMENIKDYDSSYSPNERAEMSQNEPDCGACYDGGYIDEDETVYCDCEMGDYHMDIDAEIEAEMRAEEHSERMATDYAYAVDSQGDDSPPSDW